MLRFYYFGCRGSEAGHYLYGDTVSRIADTLDGGFLTHLLDGTFARDPWDALRSASRTAGSD